jgi:hypothetical protein
MAELIKNLPFGYCIIKDAAYYQASKRLVPLFYGAYKKKQKLNDFNFYAAQLRICVEMALPC